MLACILFVFGALCEYAALLFQRGRNLELEDHETSGDEEHDYMNDDKSCMRMVQMQNQYRWEAHEQQKFR